MQNHDETNRKGRKGYKGIKVLEGSCVSPVKNTQLLLVGWASCPPLYMGAHVAHPTRLNNLLVGSL